MTSYLVRRLAQLPLVLFVISLVVFALVHIIPGDPIAIMLGPLSTPELQTALTRHYGLDQPFPQQYLAWLTHVVRADLGTSIRSSEPVAKMIGDRITATATLALASMLLSLAVSLPAGLLAATHRNTWVDHLVMVGTLAGFSVPDFVLASSMVLVLGVQLRWLPIVASGLNSRDPGNLAASYLMPTVALGAYSTAVLTRQWRSSLLDVLGRDYIRTARAKGLGELLVLQRHTIKNALTPIITIVTINFSYLLGGAIVVEQIFVIPGIGTLLLQAVIQRDFPIIQGVTLVLGLVFILSNLVTDLLYTFLDPRIKYGD